MLRLFTFFLFPILFSGLSVQAQEAPAAPSPTLAPTATQPVGRPSYEWRWAVGGGLGLDSKARFDEVKQTGSVFKLTADMTLGGALNLLAEARYMREDDWGFMGGISFDTERKVSKITVGGIESDGDFKLQITTLYANAVYQWTHWYLPFGMNFSSMKASGFDGDLDFTPGIGFQIGVGYIFNDNWSIEGLSRSHVVEAKTVAGGVTTDFGKGAIGTALILGKYTF
jgi:hypothetical protein